MLLEFLRSSSLTAICLLLAGCSDAQSGANGSIDSASPRGDKPGGADQSDGGPDSSEAQDAGGTEPACDGHGFARTAKSWALPFSLGGATAEQNELSTSSHLLLDLTGDRRPDFVVYRDDERTETDPLVGKNHWLLFRNTGRAFARSAEPWTLPYSLGGAGASTNAPSSDAHAIMDLDGDHKPDFVVYRDVERTTSDALVGKDHWLVFASTDTGFSRAPEPWSLPYSLGGADSQTNRLATQAHALLDLTGDGRPDFIVYRDVERTERDPLVGKNHWLLFRNTGTGFSRTPERWQLPYSLGGVDNPLNQIASLAHAVVDLSGDGLPDFVVYRDLERPDTDPLVGKDHWLLFRNTETGFARTSESWPLPYSLGGSNAEANTLSTNAHVLLDLSGDRRPDFVVHRDTERDTVDPLVGKDHWLLFRNTSTGFARTAAPWTLPYSLGGKEGVANTVASRAHALFDLSGSGHSDFIVFRDVERNAPDPLVGKDHWLVFETMCGQ